VSEGGHTLTSGGSGVVTAISRLRAHRRLMWALAIVGLAAVFAGDLTVSGYVPATLYLLIVVFAAAALPPRSALLVAGIALSLTLTVMTAQDRLGGENLVLVALGTLAGAGVLALAELYESAVAAEMRFRDTLASTRDGLYRIDLATGRFDYVSPSMSELTGVPASRLLELTPAQRWEAIHPDDREGAAAALEELERIGVATLEARSLVGDEYRWLQDAMHLVYDDSGRATFRVGNVRDITARRRRELNREFQEALRDELTRVTTAEEVMAVTGERLGRFLGVRYVFFVERDGDGDAATSRVVWDDGAASDVSYYGRVPDFVSGEVVRDLHEGRTVVCRDVAADPRVDAARFAEQDVASWILAPFRRGGTWRFLVSVGEDSPRDWRDAEAELLSEVAARTFPRIERARAEAALRGSEKRFRTIVTNATEGISMTGADGRVSFVNDAFVESLGYTTDEVVDHMTPFDFVDEEDRPALAAHLRLRSEGVSERYDLRMRTKAGEQRWFLVNAAPVTDDQGALLGDVALFTDITMRKEWEAALALQAHLLENVHDAICALDDAYRVIYWNEAAEELFGWTRSEALGRRGIDLLQADVPGSARDEGPAGPFGKGRYAGEVQYRRKDGRQIWVDARSQVLHRDDGTVEGVVASFRDIGEQRSAKEALAWEAARLRAIVEAAPVGLSVVAVDGEVLLRNEALREMWMGEAEVHEIADFGQYRAYWPDTGARVRPEEWPIALALTDGTASSDVVLDIERFDGSRGTIVISAAPIVDNGTILGAVSIAQDITRLREAEQALRFLTEEVRSLHEGVVLDTPVSRSQLAFDVVVQAGLLLGSDGSSIFLLEEDGALRRIAGVGQEDPPGTDDLVAQAIGERKLQIRPLPPPAWEAPLVPGSVLLAVPLVVRHHVFGALAFTYLDRRALDETQRRIAGAFADQAALAIENARLRAAIEETAIEAERTRLARDLHDSVTQSLFAASLKAEALMEMLDGRDEAADAARELRRLARGALAGMRTMLIEMRAGGLTETPLPELLRHLVEASGSRFGADVRLTTHGRRQLPPDVQTALYRIAQEALNNVARHAQASRAWVDLHVEDDAVHLEVGDDGRGFEQSQDGSGHYGLENMHARAAGIGAALTVDSRSGRGTVVAVEWPSREGRDVP
jgi:PAS domain S-box-containing protein